MSLLKTIKEQLHPEYIRDIETLDLWRAAINAQLDAGHAIDKKAKYSQIEKGAKLVTDHDTIRNYLYRFTFESPKSYNDRIRLSHDFGDSGRVVNSYVGHLLRASKDKTVEYNFGTEDINNKFKIDIDNNGTDLDVFLMAVAFELLGMGKTWVMTDADESGIPYSFIIPREDVVDWAEDADGMIFVKYRTMKFEYRDLQRYAVPQIITITRNEMIIVEKIKGKWVMGDTKPNPLGTVPLHMAKMGKQGRSIIEVISKIQIDLMNVVSELRHAIRSQALSILSVPQGTVMTDLATDTLLKIPANTYSPQWLAYPASGLDAHFKYTEFLINRIFELANLRNEKENRAAQSGISQAWDFLDTETILIVAAESIEELMLNVMNDWSQYRDTQSDNKFEIEKKFDVQALKSQLENAMKAMSIGIGRIAETSLRKQIRDSVVTLDAKDVMASDKEIEEIEDRMNENIFELNQGEIDE